MITKEYTKDQVTENFLQNIKGLCRYWNRIEDQNTIEKLEGLAFSILSCIDGCSGAMPGFILAPLPHEDDKQFHIDEEDEFYYPQNHESKVNCDIAGGLHELFYKIK